MGATFRNAWDERPAQAAALARTCKHEIAEIEKKMAGLVDRIVETQSEPVNRALESRILTLERRKIGLAEKAENVGEAQERF